MKTTSSFLVAAAAALTLASAPAAHAIEAEAIRCADFLGHPDNLPLPEVFKLSKFKFQDRSGGWAPFVNVFTDLIGQPAHGMQFDLRGLRISPPGGSVSVELRLGAFAGVGLQIEAFDAAGGLQDALFLPNDSIMHTVTLAAATLPITLVQLKGGDNEGILNWVCATR
jgi:hypothetical protein